MQFKVQTTILIAIGADLSQPRSRNEWTQFSQILRHSAGYLPQHYHSLELTNKETQEKNLVEFDLDSNACADA